MAHTSKSQRMELLAGLARTKEEKVSEALRVAREKLDKEMTQLDSLQAYRVQSLKHKSNNASAISSSYALMANLSFIAQIDQAIEQQRSVVEKQKENYESVLSIWVQLREKHKTLTGLAEKALLEEQAALDKKEEQRQVDDYIAAKYRKR